MSLKISNSKFFTLLILMFGFHSYGQTDVDLSGLTEETIQPSVPAISQAFERYHNAMTRNAPENELSDAYQKLQLSLEPIITKPATLKLQELGESELPDLENKIIDHIELSLASLESEMQTNSDHEDTESLINKLTEVIERLTYSSWEASKDCNFSIDDDESFFPYADEYMYSWESVVPIEESLDKPSPIAYIISLIIPVDGTNLQTGIVETCHHTVKKFAFDATPDQDKPLKTVDWEE